MPGLTKPPPFPDDVPTHPLLVIDFALLEAGDETEIGRLWKAATGLGFWYLKNHGVDAEVEDMYEMGRETLALPFEEKMRFELGDGGNSFGYKAPGVQAIDENGTKDTVEFLVVAKDDALAWPRVIHRTYPATVNKYMTSTIRPFVEKSLRVNDFFLKIFNDKLGLPEGTLASLHDTENESGSLARIIRAPPCRPNEKLLLPPHTDFGSITFLLNREGGLQVLPAGSTQWCYVKPIPGYAICNIGDSLNIFSGGILRSSIHRVVPPPGEQESYERWSLLLATRPVDSVVLRALSDKSPEIKSAVAKAEPGKFETGQTSKEWMDRRVAGLRYNNYKGAERWKGTWKGTEDTPIPTATKV